jgi:hypothetical protein
MTPALSLFVLASVFATPPPFFAPAPSSSAAAPVERANSAKPAAGGIHLKTFCTADCGDLNGSVSCSGSTCSAMDQDVTCPATSTPGYVTCDGVTTYCNVACCTNGALKTVSTGPICSCPDGQTSPKDRYQCVSGAWRYQFSFCAGPFCPGP